METEHKQHVERVRKLVEDVKCNAKQEKAEEAKKDGEGFSVGSMGCALLHHFRKDGELSKVLSGKGEGATGKAPREVCACRI